MEKSKFTTVISTIHVVLEDTTTPRAVREKLTNMTEYLKSGEDDQKKISTALAQLEDLSSDVNIPPYVRTQLYGVSSQLEAIGNE